MTVMWKQKKYVALMIITVLLWSISACVSAKEVSQIDEADIEKLTADVETDIYQVAMPTDTEAIFDFILDPQGLINETNGVMHKGKSFEKNCTVFFRRRDGESKVDYRDTSDSVTITNKSTMPVEVSLEVKVDPSSLDGITMTKDKAFKNDKDASLYLAVVDGKKTVPVGKDGVVIHKTIDAAPDGTYEYAYNSNIDKYEYRLKKNIEEKVFEKYSFRLIGAANEQGDWSAFTKVVPKILVTWKVMPGENTALREDAVLHGKESDIKLDDLNQENEQQDRENEGEKVVQPNEDTGEVGEKEEKAATAVNGGGKSAMTGNEGREKETQPAGTADGTGTEKPAAAEEVGKNLVTDESETEGEASARDKSDIEEKVDIDTEELDGE